MVLRRKVLICPSFLHIWLPDLSNVLQVFWRSFRVLLWTFAAFSLLFSPVFVPTFFRGILFSLCVKHKPLNTDGCSSLLRNTVYSSHLMSACYIVSNAVEWMKHGYSDSFASLLPKFDANKDKNQTTSNKIVPAVAITFGFLLHVFRATYPETSAFNLITTTAARPA